MQVVRDDALRLAFAKKIRELRRAKGLSGKDFAERAQLSEAAVSKFERGLLKPNERFIEKAIEVMDLDSKDAVALRELGAILHSRLQRWGVDATEVRNNQIRIGAREKGATYVRSFWTQVVPGLVQSEAYMRAVIQSLTKASDSELDSIIKARKKRQSLLKGNDRAFHFVLGESCLRTCVCSNQIMFDQLKHLEKVNTNYPSVEIRILPFSRVLTRIALHSFVIYDDKRIEVEIGHGQVDFLVEEDRELDLGYIDLMNYLISNSLSRAESTEFISSLANEYAKQG